MNLMVYEIPFEDCSVFVAYPEEEIYSEVVGVGCSVKEAEYDLASSFNSMMYSENGALILIDDKAQSI